MANNTPAPGQKFVSPEDIVTPNVGSLDVESGTMLAGMRTGGGTFTLNGATPVTVADVRIGAKSIIIIGLKTVGGTVGALPVVQTKTAATGFTIAGTASDTSVYSYVFLG